MCLRDALPHATSPFMSADVAEGQSAVNVCRRAKPDGERWKTWTSKHGRSGLARLVLGSVATGTLQRANVPLMIVGPAGLRASTAPVVAEPTAQPTPTETMVTVSLSPADLDLLQRGL